MPLPAAISVVENREAGPVIEITEIWLSWLNGLTHLGLGQARDALCWPEGGGCRIQNPHSRIAAESTSYDSDPALRLTYPWPGVSTAVSR
ncbi:MAG: hypothetical protein IAF02_07995 [Anaerolineae bacterium]|nr:hypothetical protein [Anaerolineae bacterium]